MGTVQHHEEKERLSLKEVLLLKGDKEENYYTEYVRTRVNETNIYKKL